MRRTDAEVQILFLYSDTQVVAYVIGLGNALCGHLESSFAVFQQSVAGV